MEIKEPQMLAHTYKVTMTFVKSTFSTIASPMMNGYDRTQNKIPYFNNFNINSINFGNAEIFQNL
jgi:hypothetical protein